MSYLPDYVSIVKIIDANIVVKIYEYKNVVNKRDYKMVINGEITASVAHPRHGPRIDEACPLELHRAVYLDAELLHGVDDACSWRWTMRRTAHVPNLSSWASKACVRPVA